MLAEITAALAGLKAASDLTGMLVKLKLDTAVTSKVIESQGAILTSQQAMFQLNEKYQELLTINDDLKKQLTEKDNWDAEAQRYELTEIAPSVFVYASKPNDGETAPIHWLCANCFTQSHKSILQRESRSHRGTHYRCPRCKFETVDSNHPLVAGPVSVVRA